MPIVDQGYNQINPFNKIQLPYVGSDIRRSCVAIFFRIGPVSKQFTLVALDFMHGRWPGVALERKERIAEVLERQAQTQGQSKAFDRWHSMHLVYLSSAARWWTNSLNSVNEQLIISERKL